MSLMPAGSGLDTIMLVNSGSEGNELAWRFARAVTGAEGAIVTEHAYHGDTTEIADLSPEEWPEAYAPPHVLPTRERIRRLGVPLIRQHPVMPRPPLVAATHEVDHLPHNHPKGNHVPLAGPQLSQQPQKDALRDLVRSLSVAKPHERPLADEIDVVLEQPLVLPRLQQPLVLAVPSIMHRGESPARHRLILRVGKERPARRNQARGSARSHASTAFRLRSSSRSAGRSVSHVAIRSPST